MITKEQEDKLYSFSDEYLKMIISAMYITVEINSNCANIPIKPGYVNLTDNLIELNRLDKKDLIKRYIDIANTDLVIRT
jgi:hypothetical protein